MKSGHIAHDHYVSVCVWRCMKSNSFGRKGKPRKSIDLKLCIIDGNTTTTNILSFILFEKEENRANDGNWSNRSEH